MRSVFAHSCALLLFSVTAPLPADVVYHIDFGTLEAGTNWINAVAVGTGGLTGFGGDDLTDLTDFSDGTATGAALTGFGFSGGTGGTVGAFSDGWLTSAAAGQAVSGTVAGGAVQLAFSGLDASLDYRLEVVSLAATDSGITADYTANGVFADVTAKELMSGSGASGQVGDDWRPFTDGASAEDWMVWTSLTAADGTLTLNVVPESGSRAQINALRLAGTASVPEPSGYAAFVAVALFAALRRRQ